VEENSGSSSAATNILQAQAKSPSLPNVLLTRAPSFSSPPASPGSQSSEYLLPEPRLDVRTFVTPLLLLLGQACAGVEITSRAMQILASMAEFLLRFLVVESARVARYKPPHTVSTLQVQAAVRRALPSEFAREAIKSATDSSENTFQNRALLLVHSAAGFVHPLWSVSFEDGADTFIANVMVYGVKQVLVVAAGNAKKAGRWIINTNDLLQAIETVITIATPIWKAVLAAKERSLISLIHSGSGLEGAILMPPCSPRASAADKIYFTSIIGETPLQTDNQILIMFLFLASLSLRAIIVA
jgi:histone H3/H4